MATAEPIEPRRVPAVPAPEFYPQAYYYEDEIDLHSYVDVLLKYWWLVVGVPLVAIAVAAVLGFSVMQPRYRATALVAVTSPRYIVQLSPNFETVPINQRQIPFRAYPAIATSGDLLQRLMTTVGDMLPAQQRTMPALRGMVSAKNGADQSIIELTVTARSADLAAQLANAWADEFTATVQSVYGQNADEVSQFEEQLERARQRRDAAEQAVIEFQARNPSAVLSAHIQALQDGLVGYLSTQRSIERILRDAVSLRQRLSLLPASGRSTLGDDLSALMLEVRSLSSSLPLAASGEASAQALASSGLALQVQVQAGSTLSDKTLAEQIAFLDSLTTALESSRQALDADLAAIEPEMLALQQQQEQAQTEANQLLEERQIARDLYHSLSLKLEESRLDAGTNGREVQVAVRAVPPEQPSSPKKMMMLLIAAALGLMVGAIGAFVVNFFAGGRPAK